MNTTTQHIKKYMNKTQWENIYEENSTFVIEAIIERFDISVSRATKIAYEMIREREIVN